MNTRTSTNPDAERAVASWRRWKWLGLAVFTLVFTGVVGVAQFLPNLYTATATILIERTLLPGSSSHDAASELEARLQTIREQVQSRARLWNVITTYNLYPELRAHATPDVVVMQMRRELSVETKGSEGGHGPASMAALTISYQGLDPKTVAAVANHLATDFVEENMRSRERASRGTLGYLRSQLDEARERLQSHEARMSSYKRQYGGELPNSRESVIAGLERLSSQLNRNLDAQARARDRLADVERELATPSLPPPLPDGTESDEAKLARLRAALAELRQRYTEQYPDIAALKGEIASLEQRMRERAPGGDATTATRPSATRAARQKTALETELKALREEEDRLRPLIAGHVARLERIPQRDVELEEMARGYAGIREQYEALLRRYSDAALMEGVEMRTVDEAFSILDPAVPPSGPSAPNRQRLLIMGLVFALGLTIAAMFAADRLDSSFHTVSELRAFTSVPVLATVPPIVTRGDKARGVLRAGLTAASLVLAVAAVLGGAYVIADGNQSLVRMVSRGGS